METRSRQLTSVCVIRHPDLVSPQWLQSISPLNSKLKSIFAVNTQQLTLGACSLVNRASSHQDQVLIILIKCLISVTSSWWNSLCYYFFCSTQMQPSVITVNQAVNVKIHPSLQCNASMQTYRYGGWFICCKMNFYLYLFSRQYLPLWIRAYRVLCWNITTSSR